MISLKYLTVFTYCITIAVGEIVDIRNCPEDINNCIVNEARIVPCPEALDHRACNVHRRKKSSISFDFTPSFDADSLEAALTWVKDDTQELPLITLDKDACKYTPCPVRSNSMQTFTTDVPIESKFPLNAYTIKWALKAPSGQKCCFTTDIRIVR